MTDKVRVITEEQYREYMELKKRVNRRWKPIHGEQYWYVGSDGDFYTDIWEGCEDIDGGRYNLGNVFKTEQEAQKELDRRLAEQELLDMCNWDGGENLYFIRYNDQKDAFDCVWFGSIYSPYRFASEESAQKAIDALGVEKLKLILRHITKED